MSLAKTSQRRYWEKNRAIINAKNFARYYANKDLLRTARKTRRTANREAYLAKRKEYYRKNVEALHVKQREHRVKNPATVKAVAKKYREGNRPTVRAIQKRYYEANKAKISARSSSYRKSNRPQWNEYIRKRRERDANFKILCNLRKRMWAAVTQQRGHKSDTTRNLIGCDSILLRAWLESKFSLGMTWGNYGEWHVDHEIPCAEFDLRVASQQQRAFHYSNLQPLWGPDNMSKGDKVPNQHQPEIPMPIL